MKDQRAEVLRLADELFCLVERSQGYFFVSDGETFKTTDEFFERIRGRLEFGKRAVSDMRGFLRKHGQLRAKKKRAVAK